MARGSAARREVLARPTAVRRRPAAARTTARAPARNAATRPPSSSASGTAIQPPAANTAAGPSARAGDNSPSRSSCPANAPSSASAASGHAQRKGSGRAGPQPPRSRDQAHELGARGRQEQRGEQAGERKVGVPGRGLRVGAGQQVAQLVQRERRGGDQGGGPQPRGHAQEYGNTRLPSSRLGRVRRVSFRFTSAQRTRHRVFTKNPATRANLEVRWMASSSTSTPFPASTTGPGRWQKAWSSYGLPRTTPPRPSSQLRMSGRTSSPTCPTSPSESTS